MRLLIFSDLHGNQYAWRAFLRCIDGLDYDRAVFLGDFFGYYYGQEEIFRGLAEFPRLLWLKGNHELLFERLLQGKEPLDRLTERYGSSYSLRRDDAAWMEKELSGLPFSLTLEEDGRRILFWHGTPQDPAEGRLYPRDNWEPAMCQDFDVVICGHTHFRMERISDGKLWLNAGSLGQPRDGNHSGFLLLDTLTGAYQYRDVFYDKAPLYREIAAHDPELTKLKEILGRERE